MIKSTPKEDTMTRTKQQRQTRNQQLTAAGIRKAAEYFAAAIMELENAQHDAKTSGIEIDVAMLDVLELGEEPETIESHLRHMADEIEATGSFTLDA
jgi:hypothetical protein